MGKGKKKEKVLRHREIKSPYVRHGKENNSYIFLIL